MVSVTILHKTISSPSIANAFSLCLQCISFNISTGADARLQNTACKEIDSALSRRSAAGLRIHILYTYCSHHPVKLYTGIQIDCTFVRYFMLSLCCNSGFCNAVSPIKHQRNTYFILHSN